MSCTRRATRKFCRRRAGSTNEINRGNVGALRNAAQGDRVRMCVAVVATECLVEPETEEVIHCLAELVTAGSPEATKRFFRLVHRKPASSGEKIRAVVALPRRLCRFQLSRAAKCRCFQILRHGMW